MRGEAKEPKTQMVKQGLERSAKDFLALKKCPVIKEGRDQDRKKKNEDTCKTHIYTFEIYVLCTSWSLCVIVP